LLALLGVVGLECLELAQAAGAIRMFTSEPGKQAAGRRELEVSLVLFVPTHAQVNPKTKAHNPPATLPHQTPCKPSYKVAKRTQKLTDSAPFAA